MKCELEDARQTICELEAEVNTLRTMVEVKDEKLKKCAEGNKRCANNEKLLELEQRNLNLERVNEELSNELLAQRDQNNILKSAIAQANAQSSKFKHDNKPCTRPANSIILKLHGKIKQMVDCIMELLVKEELSNPISCYKEVAELLAEIDCCFTPAKTFSYNRHMESGREKENGLTRDHSTRRVNIFERPRESRDQRSITIASPGSRTNSVHPKPKGAFNLALAAQQEINTVPMTAREAERTLFGTRHNNHERSNSRSQRSLGNSIAYVFGLRCSQASY